MIRFEREEVVSIILFLLILILLVEVEQGLFLSRLAFGQSAEGDESTWPLFIRERRLS